MILNKLFYSFAYPEFWGLKAGLKFKVMKTTYYTYRLNRIIILISIFLLILSFAVNAQQRSSRNGDKNRSRTGTTTVQRGENSNNSRMRATTVQRRDNTNRNRTGTTTIQRSNDNRNARTSLNYDRRKSTSSNQGRFIEREPKPKKQTYTYKSNDYKNHKPKNKSYNKHNWYHKKHHAYKKPYYYKKHYHTSPWTYYNYPTVFYHANFGEFYYHSGRFYRYDWRHGYFTVDMPTHVYFNTIPHGYRRTYINGRLYYQYHDVIFRHTPHGYKIVPRSSGIYFHASF